MKLLIGFVAGVAAAWAAAAIWQHFPPQFEDVWDGEVMIDPDAYEQAAGGYTAPDEYRKRVLASRENR